MFMFGVQMESGGALCLSIYMSLYLHGLHGLEA